MGIKPGPLIEPYRDNNGTIGFIEVRDGYIKHHNQAEWAQSENSKDLVLFADVAEGIWELPNRPDTSKYANSFEEYLNRVRAEGITVDDENIRDIHKDWVRDTLKEIHGRLARLFRKFIYFYDERMYCYLANLTISTYFREQIYIAPLTILDGVKGSGKTTVLNLLDLVCYRAYMPSSYTAPSCISLVDEFNVTLLLDEGINNLRAERGGEIYNMLLNVFSRKTARKTRTNATGVTVDIQFHYTNVVFTTRGAELAEDLRSRAFVYTMGLPGKKTSLEDALYYDDLEYPPGLHPADIRTDLYALRTFTMSDVKGEKLRGIWLDSFREESKKNLSEYDGQNYLYGYIHGIPNAPRIANRTKDLAGVYYMLGLATESAEDMIRLILDNEEAIKARDTETIEAVLFTALHDLIIAGYTTLYPGDIPAEGLGEADLREICMRISLKDIREGYTNLRIDLEGYEKREIEDSRTLTAKFRTMRIPYKPGAARVNYLDPHNSQFMPSIRAAINNYCPPSERGIYNKILYPNFAKKPENDEKSE